MSSMPTVCQRIISKRIVLLYICLFTCSYHVFYYTMYVNEKRPKGLERPDQAQVGGGVMPTGKHLPFAHLIGFPLSAFLTDRICEQ